MADRSRLHVKGIVRGYHVYKYDCTPDIGDGFDGRIKKKIVLVDMLLLLSLDITWLDTSHEKFPRSSAIS